MPEKNNWSQNELNIVISKLLFSTRLFETKVEIAKQTKTNAIWTWRSSRYLKKQIILVFTSIYISSCLISFEANISSVWYDQITLKNNQNLRLTIRKIIWGLRPATLLKKRLWHRCFPVNFVKFLRTHFFTEHLWWLLLTSHWINGFYWI